MLKQRKVKFSPIDDLMPAKSYKRVIALFLDIMFLLVAVKVTFTYFNINIIFPHFSFMKQVVAVTLYFHFILVILPHSFLSQTLGQFLCGLKLVNIECERLNLLNCIFRDSILWPLSLLIPWTLKPEKGMCLHDRIVRSIVVES